MPMGLVIKICGINSVEAADAAVRAGADFAGLVFHRNSPRSLTPDLAAALASRMRGRIRLVALFADADDDEIAEAVKAVRPDYLQLHGNETPQRASQTRAQFALPVIKALSIAGEPDVAAAAGFEEAADMLLFDAKAPAGAVRPGGHGAAFDWKLLRTRNFSRPWLLAGGLNCGNVARAIESSGAPGVDVSSGVETAPGEKSAAMIRAFVAAARGQQFAENGA